MKVIILGAGRVGLSVAEKLIDEGHDITIIDTDSSRIFSLREKLEIRGIVGDAINPSILSEAGAVDADMLIACTASDSTNLVSCKIAQKIFNTPMRIARLRSNEYQKDSGLLKQEIFAVNGVICPERSITQYIKQLIEFPASLQIRDFFDGLACLVSTQIEPHAPMANRSIAELSRILPDSKFRVVAIYRRFRTGPDHLIACDSTTTFLPGDEVFILLDKQHVNNILAVLHGYVNPIRSVTIAGGGRIGLHLAKQLNQLPTVDRIKIIEKKKPRCLYLTSELPTEILVLNGIANDEDLLSQENIEQTDLFIALTEYDEDNLIACLQAKRMGAKRVITVLNRPSYADLMHGTQIDVAIAPAQVIMDQLLTFVRTSNIKSIYSLRRGMAETIEIAAVGDAKNSKVVGKKISEIKLPTGASIGLLARNLTTAVAAEDSADDEIIVTEPEILIADSNCIIQANDRLLIFLPDKKTVPKIEKMFAAAATFL